MTWRSCRTRGHVGAAAVGAAAALLRPSTPTVDGALGPPLRVPEPQVCVGALIRPYLRSRHPRSNGSRHAFGAMSWWIALGPHVPCG